MMRGFGILCILFMNITIAALPTDFDYNVMSAVDEVLFVATRVLTEGSSRFIFCMLFGIGFLISSQKETTGYQMRYYRRLFLLFTFGAVNYFVFLWHGDTLMVYSVAGAMLFPVRRWKWEYLALLAVGISAALYTLYFVSLEGVVDARNDMLLGNGEAWEALVGESVRVNALAESIRKADYSSWWSLSLHLLSHKIGVWIVVDVWEAVAVMLVGMALLKQGFFDYRNINNYYYFLPLCLVAMVFNGWVAMEQIQAEHDIYVSYTNMFLSYRLANLMMTVGVLSGVMILVKKGLLRSVRTKLSNIGRMSLTNYLCQSIAFLLIFLWGGLFGKLNIAQLYIVVLVLWVCHIYGSNWWLSRKDIGPFELMWKRLYYLG